MSAVVSGRVVPRSAVRTSRRARGAGAGRRSVDCSWRILWTTEASVAKPNLPAATVSANRMVSLPSSEHDSRSLSIEIRFQEINALQNGELMRIRWRRRRSSNDVDCRHTYSLLGSVLRWQDYFRTLAAFCARHADVLNAGNPASSRLRSTCAESSIGASASLPSEPARNCVP
jgi:hypothetical protein